MAFGENPDASRQRLLPRFSDELVRGQRGQISLRNGEKQAPFEAYYPTHEESQAGLGLLGPRGQTLHSVLLSHTKQLVAPSTCCGQSRVHGQGREPSLRSDQPFLTGVRGARALREAVLRSRGDGEPHQGATAVLVRRQDQLGNHESQPATPMVLLAGLCDSQRASRRRASGNANGRSDLREHAAEAVEDRGTREGERSSHRLQHGKWLSRSGSVPFGSLESTAELPLEVLTATNPIHRQRIAPGG